VTKIKALALFSGGLDSILAARLIMDQGIEVEAVQFVTPFFNYHVLEDIGGQQQMVMKKYGITLLVEDISEEYLQLLHRPDHGFGKHFNPCIDCKIMMLRRAKEMLAERGASFLISGEVLGQRPMSQRRDTLNVVERDSGTRSLLLRPLCAQLMTETEAEKRGWVDRSKLLRMSGRGRSQQMALAAAYGITDYPAPAGGCILADPILSRRIEQLYSSGTMISGREITVFEVRSLLIGRQFLLPGGSWLILGRDEKENMKLEKLAGEKDMILLMENWPGPLGVLKPCAAGGEGNLADDIERAAGLVVRYGKNGKVGGCQTVTCLAGGERRELQTAPLSETLYSGWQME
jgi:tRNA-specific 2-thiouridylase